MKSLLKASFLLLLLSICHVQGFANPNEYKAFQVEVSGQGSSVFLIPGATCSGDVWKQTLVSLEKQHTCHVFTLAGYAGVPALEETPMLETIKRALASYIEKHRNESVTVIGHSIGGFLASWLAIDHPQLIDKVMIVDALPFLAAATNPSATQEGVKSQLSLAYFVNQYEQMDSTAFRNMQNQVVNSMLKNNAYQEEVLGWSLQSDRTAMAHTMYEMMTKDLRDDISKIQCPVLVLAAWDSEGVLSRDQIENTYQLQYSKLPKVEVRIAKDARHFIMLDQPEWFLTQTREFVK